MPKTLVTVTLAATSGIEEDNTQNGFVIDGPVPVQGDTLPLTQCFRDFYNRPGDTAGDQPANYIARSRSRAVAGSIVRYYDITGHLDGSPHGSPVAEDAFTLGPSAATVSLPEEVALVVTLRALDWAEQPIERPDGPDPDNLVDRPRQRFSGRLYFGPLNAAVLVDGVNNEARPGVLLAPALLDAAETLADDLIAIGYEWHVWSRKDAVTRPITHVQVDNAFDTQRRRGVQASTRTTRQVFP